MAHRLIVGVYRNNREETGTVGQPVLPPLDSRADRPHHQRVHQRLE